MRGERMWKLSVGREVGVCVGRDVGVCEGGRWECVLPPHPTELIFAGVKGAQCCSSVINSKKELYKVNADDKMCAITVVSRKSTQLRNGI